MVVYTYTKARQYLASLLKQAKKDGSVLIRKKDGQVFLVKAIKQPSRKKSPLDIKGVKLGISRSEILEFIRESRKIA